MKDPWGIRASREETVLVSISKVLPMPVMIPPTYMLAVVSVWWRRLFQRRLNVWLFKSRLLLLRVFFGIAATPPI